MVQCGPVKLRRPAFARLHRLLRQRGGVRWSVMPPWLLGRPALIATWLLLTAAVVNRWFSSIENSARLADFGPVYFASGAFLDGGSLYDVGDRGFPLVYLPAVALLFLPFRLLTLAGAVDVLIAVELVLLVAACAVLVRHYSGPRITIPASALVLVLSEATLNANIHGNVDLLLLPLMAVLVTAVDRGRHAAAGIAYGLMIAVKPLVPLPGLLALSGRQWRFVMACAAVVVGLSLPVVLLADTGGFFTEAVPLIASGEPFEFIQVQSIAVNSVFRNEPQWLRVALRVSALVVGLVAVALVWRRRGLPEGVRWLEVTAAGQAMLGLVNGFTFTHHVAVCLLLVPAACHPRSLARSPLVLSALALLALPRPLPTLTMQGQQCIALFLLLAALAWTASRLRDERADLSGGRPAP